MSSGWVHEQPVDGVRVTRAGDTIVAEWEGLGQLRANTDGSRAEFIGAEGASPGAIVKHRRVVEALLRHLQGELTFHASAVSRHDVGLAFLGDQGAGKSTMAAALGRRASTSFVADDCLDVDLLDRGAYVQPSRETHWLDAQSCAALGLHAGIASVDKSSHAPLSRQTRPARLAAVVKLVFDDDSNPPRLVRIRGREDFLLLEAAMFRFALFDGDVLARDLDRLSRLAECVPVYTLKRPRSFRGMDACVELLTDLFQAGGA